MKEKNKKDREEGRKNEREEERKKGWKEGRRKEERKEGKERERRGKFLVYLERQVIWSDKQHLFEIMVILVMKEKGSLC